MNECEGEFGCLWWEGCNFRLGRVRLHTMPENRESPFRRLLRICRFSVAQWALTLYINEMTGERILGAEVSWNIYKA